MLEINGVTAAYPNSPDIIHEISIKAKRGAITAIIGPNGAGKSTLLKTIFNLTKKKKGKILLDGKDITNVNPKDMLVKGVGYIPQLRSIFPDLTVEENLLMGLWTLKDKKRSKSLVKNIYNIFPILNEKRNALAKHLSGGQQRILEIGRTMLIDPVVYLFDEPTSGLAPKVAKEIYEIIVRLKEKRVILLVDQNVRSAVFLSDYLYILKLGKVHLEGPKKYFEKELKPLIRDWLV